MTLGFRTRLVLISLAFLLVGGVLGYLYLDARFTEIVMRTGVDDRAREAMRAALARSALVGGGIAIAVALFMSFLASTLLSRELRGLATRARAALGEDPGDVGGDLASLRGSVGRLTHELERSVGNLATERDRLRAVLGGIGEGVVAVDEKLRVEFANDAAAVLLGRDPDGRALVELIRNPDVLELLEEDGQAEVEVPHGDRFILVRKSGRRKTGGFVLVLLDITQQRRLERVRRDFVANVSHELRTPVAVIRTNAEALAGGGLAKPERATLFVERTLRHAERLSDLIDDLLDLFRIEAGALPMELEAVELRAAIESAASGAAPDEDIEIELEAELVQADRQALQRILVNLIENAFGHGGERVLARSFARKGRVVLEIHDDGPGVPEKHRERIFERFYRVDKGRDRKSGGGTGIGLSLVKHLARAQGGQAGYRPAEPQGSVFSIELPKA